MPNKDLVLLTGGSGFVGSAVARELLRNGYAVRALVRSSSKRDNLAGLGVEYADGDMQNKAAVALAMRGCRYVFHVAADYRLWAPDPTLLQKANCEGTRTVMLAALQAGVERVVYTSSVATLQVNEDGRVSDETMPMSENAAIGVYKRSKIAAERIVERMVADERLPAVIVNPSTPVGPRDIKPTPTGRIIVEAARGRMPAFVDTGLNLVHVDDVASGHVAALQKGRIGSRYILGGENMLLGEMLAHIARLTGRRAPTVKLPRSLIFPLAYAAQAVAHITKQEPFVTVDGLKMAKYKMYFSSGKAVRELGYSPRPAADGLRDALQWFKQAGYLE